MRFDPRDLPALSEADRRHLLALGSKPKAAIDVSDIPELSGDVGVGERGRFYHPVKRQITARLDADVLAWLKSAGKGYQSRMNAILRREMLEAFHRDGAR